MPRKSNSTSHLSARPSKGKDVGRNLTSEAIAADLTAFRKQGGRIEVLGNTPLSATNVTAFRSKSDRSEEHTSELQSLMRISYDVFCLKTKYRKLRRTPITRST